MRELKQRKKIDFAYPRSRFATRLDYEETGCHHIATAIKLEDGNWSQWYLPHNAEGYADAKDPDLLAQYAETEGVTERVARIVELLQTLANMDYDTDDEGRECMVYGSTFWHLQDEAGNLLRELLEE